MKIISTVALGDGAFGQVAFFTVPRGARMHYLGNIPHDKVPLLDEKTTTLEGGEERGAFRVKTIQARTSIDLKVAGDFEIRVGGKAVFKGALLATYDNPKSFAPAIELKSADAFDVKVTLPIEPALKLPPLPKGSKASMVLLTLELDGDPA
jgi:hypothetical protein